jgi:hypothetical protein
MFYEFRRKRASRMAPVLVSMIAIIVAKRAVTRSVRPVLVFVCEVRDEVWCVQNVGTGPALDILVAEKDRDEQPWARFMRVPPLPRDGKIRLRSAPRFLAVTHHDAENNAYSTICSGYRNRLQKGHVFDKPDEDQIAWIHMDGRNDARSVTIPAVAFLCIAAATIAAHSAGR